MSFNEKGLHDSLIINMIIILPLSVFIMFTPLIVYLTFLNF